MLELSSVRKHKINLADYPFQQDLDSRFLLSDLSVFDFSVLEEILFNHLKISIKKLSRTLDCQEEDLHPVLRKLVQCGLIDWQNDSIQVDKERRKHFEFQIERFKDDFNPDMDFLQGLLRQVPIHILPAWYSIPRTSNNIFESIVEKHLLTPQLYQRYLSEVHFPDPILSNIIRDVFASSDLKISSSDLISKYNLSRRDFDQMMLQLEFHLVCFVSYAREEDHWHEFVTPFHEWRQYLLFLQKTEVAPLDIDQPIQRLREHDFAFVDDLGLILAFLKKKNLSLEKWNGSDPLPLPLTTQLAPPLGLSLDDGEEILMASNYLSKLLQKALLIKLAERTDGKLRILDSAADWISLNLENRSLNLYRHSLNHLNFDSPLSNEKNLREAEKAIKRALHGGWLYFEDFVRGVVVPLGDATVMLRKTGKHWRYCLPEHNDEEKAFIKAVVMEWLFECGITAVGKLNGKDCFCVTPFGQFFFED